MGIFITLVIIVVIIAIIIRLSLGGTQKNNHNQVSQPEPIKTTIEINPYQVLFNELLTSCKHQIYSLDKNCQLNGKYQIKDNNNYFIIATHYGKTPIIYVYYGNLYYNLDQHKIEEEKSCLVETNLNKVRIDYAKNNMAYPMFYRLEDVVDPEDINHSDCVNYINSQIKEYCDFAKEEWLKYANLRWEVKNVNLKNERLWEVSKYETDFRNEVENFIRGDKFKTFLDKFDINEFNFQYHVNLSELLTYIDRDEHEKLSLYHIDCVLFYGTQPLIAFEIDGQQHDNNVKQILKDKFKDDCLKNCGIDVVRIKSDSFDKDKDLALNIIITKIKKTCPNCLSELKTKSRNDTGEEFIGCSNFPECKYTRNIDN